MANDEYRAPRYPPDEEAGPSGVTVLDGITVNFSGVGTVDSPLSAEVQAISNEHISASAGIVLSKLASQDTATLLGNNSGGVGPPLALTAAQVRTLLNVANGATANSPDAFLLARGNHTGSQLLTTISDVTASAAEVNVLDGLNASTAELNVLDGITVTVTELNFVGGVTGPLQSQIDLKAPLASPVFTGNPTAPTQAAGSNNTRLATTAFVSTAIADLIGTAPGVLDTLGEISDAINDDANFYTTLTTLIAGKVSDASYDQAAWDGVTTIAPSKNAVRDIIQSLQSLYQPLDGDLTAISALTTDSFGRNLLTLATAPALLAATGVASSAAELNILDGATLSTTELNFVDGVTSSIQTQLNNKQPLDTDLTAIALLSTATFGRGLLELTTQAGLLGQTGITASAAEVNVLDGVAISTTELNYLTGATSALQGQIDGKIGSVTTSDGTTVNFSGAGTAGSPLTAEVQNVVSDATYDQAVWDGDTAVAPSKNAVRDIIQSVLLLTQNYADGKVSDVAYASSWNGVTGVAPSKNAVWDITESVSATIVAEAARATAAEALLAPLASPTFTGNPLAPTQTAGSNNTRLATTAFVSTAIANLLGTAPGVLDTLGEISDAINDDANFYTTLTTLIAGKVSDATYGSGWNGVTGVAPSQNAVYDKFESVASVIAALNGSVTAGGLTIVDGGNTVTFDSTGLTLPTSTSTTTPANINEIRWTDVGGTGTERGSMWVYHTGGLTEMRFNLGSGSPFDKDFIFTIAGAPGGIYAQVVTTDDGYKAYGASGAGAHFYEDSGAGVVGWSTTDGGTPTAVATFHPTNGLSVSGQPKAKVTHNTTQSLTTSGTPQVLVFNAEEYDVGGFHTTGGTNDRLTIPAGAAGTYIVGTSVAFATNGTGRRQVQITKNGTAIDGGTVNVAATTAGNTIISVVTEVEVIAGDILRVEGLQTSTAALNVNSALTAFWCRKVT